MSYDATKAIATALEQLPQPDRQEINRRLRSPEFKVNSATGKFRFDSNTGERVSLAQNDAVIKIQDGKFVRIE